MALCAACQLFVSLFGLLAWKTYTPVVKQDNTSSNGHNSQTISVAQISSTSNGHSSGVYNMAFVPTNNIHIGPNV